MRIGVEKLASDRLTLAMGTAPAAIVVAQPPV
jgi:hypothetical protein